MKKKRLISIFLAIAVCISVLSVPAFAAAAQPTQQEAVEWLYAQKDQYYNLDGRYGAQCSDLVSAYMNWLIDRNVYSRRYGVYNANYYPTVAGWRTDLWEVIPNTPEFVPQPGDIFVSRGLAGYGHTGIVLTSTVSTATVIDQNSINPNEITGHSAYIHQISWSGSYAPTYYIRYRHFATPPICSHSYRNCVEAQHPHKIYRLCDKCGDKQYTGSNSYSSNCKTCNPSCDHSYLNCVESGHPHRTYQYCIDCGDKRYTGNTGYSSNCETCNPVSQWTNWSAWSTNIPTQTSNREVEKRQTVEGYNLVVYVTQEATYPYTRNFRNYSVNGNFSAYGLRSSYGEFAYSRYASKAEVDAAKTCREGDYIRQDSAHVGGRYRGNGTAYYFSDGYYWYIESPVTKTEYRFRDRATLT